MYIDRGMVGPCPLPRLLPEQAQPVAPRRTSPRGGVPSPREKAEAVRLLRTLGLGADRVARRERG
jgi:hypothetical protein